MRNWLMVLLLGVGLSLSGFYTVDERAVAIVSYANKTKSIYTTGVHWKIPFYGKLIYVYTNIRHARLSLAQPLKLANGQQLQATIDLSWQVSNPQLYLDYLTTQSLKMLNLQISAAAVTIVQKLAATAMTSQELLEKTRRFNNKSAMLISNCGLQLTSLQLTSLMLIESAPQPSLSAESAYDSAQQIKLTSEAAYQANLKQLKAQNEQFYAYFMKINNYRLTAKSKQDVPPLAQLSN